MAILLALALSNHSVGILEITTSLTFLLSPHIDEFCHAVKSLKKLHFTLTHDWKERETRRLLLTHNWDKEVRSFPVVDYIELSDVAHHDAHEPHRWTFGKFQSHAGNLQELTIRDSPTRYSGWGIESFLNDVEQLPLRGGWLPNLRSLTLTNMTCSGEILLRLFSESKKLTHVELEDMYIVDPNDDWLLWPRFFSGLRAQTSEGRNVLKSIKFYGCFDRIGRPDATCGRDKDSHMGLRESHDPNSLGRRMEDFIWGKTSKCLWTPVTRHYYSDWHGIVLNATLKVFIDEELDTRKRRMSIVGNGTRGF